MTEAATFSRQSFVHIALPTGNGWAARPMVPDDARYVHECYVKNYTDAKRRTLDMPRQCFDEGVEAIWRRLLRDALGIVAVSAEDPDLIVSWILYEPGNRAVHYMHTRERLQKMGVGQRMLLWATQGWTNFAYTHQTPAWGKFRDALGLPCHYDPYRAMFNAEEMRGL